MKRISHNVIGLVVCISMLTFIIGISILSVLRDTHTIPQKKEESLNVVVIHININDAKKDLPVVLDYYGIKHPDIVYAQAVLETGHFKSRICKDYNNLFGLYNSKTKDYYKFNHWIESVEAYKNMIQYKYLPNKDTMEEYFFFLDTLGYAKDPNYVNKIKKIINE